MPMSWRDTHGATVMCVDKAEATPLAADRFLPSSAANCDCQTAQLIACSHPHHIDSTESQTDRHRSCDALPVRSQLSAACQALLTKLDIAAAATLDKSTPVWVALTGVAAGASAMGCHLYQHFQVGGCPEFVTALCEDAFGYQLSGIGRLGVFAVAAVLALWQLRMWSMLAVSASSPDNPVASTVAFFTTATRLLLLHSAATALTGGAGVSGYLPAGMLYILSLAPLALALTKGKDLVSGGTDSATKGKDLVSEASSDFASASATTFVPPVSGAAEVAPAILGAGVTADAVFLALLATAPNGVAEAGLLPPIALAALALLQTACAAVAPLQASFRKRLSGCQAEEGDIVKVHISVAVHDTAVVLDTTHGMEPLLIKAEEAVGGGKPPIKAEEPLI
eukprot:gene3507-13578_t